MDRKGVSDRKATVQGADNSLYPSAFTGGQRLWTHGLLDGGSRLPASEWQMAQPAAGGLSAVHLSASWGQWDDYTARIAGF